MILRLKSARSANGPNGNSFSGNGNKKKDGEDKTQKDADDKQGVSNDADDAAPNLTASEAGQIAGDVKDLITRFIKDESGSVKIPFTRQNAGNGVATNTVFRSLRKGENPSQGLNAKSPGANTNVGSHSHVMGKQETDLISTTRDKDKALNKFNSENGVVEIDLGKVDSEVIDASKGVGKGRVFSRTKSD